MQLREMRLDDADDVLRWRNAPHVAEVMFHDAEIDPETHAAWMARVLEDDSVRYWIIEHDGRGVGVANLADISWTHSRCAWAYYLGDLDVPAPVGLALEFEVMRIAFADLGINKLISEVLAFNDRVIALHERVGFTVEGTLRQHITRSDGVHDVVVLSMLKDEWQQRHGRRNRV